MAFFLVGIGILLAYLDWLGAGNLAAAGKLFKQEMFTGQNPFYKWFGALIIVALLGYVPNMRPVSYAFLVLIILSILLSHESGFAKLMGAGRTANSPSISGSQIDIATNTPPPITTM